MSSLTTFKKLGGGATILTILLSFSLFTSPRKVEAATRRVAFVTYYIDKPPEVTLLNDEVLKQGPVSCMSISNIDSCAINGIKIPKGTHKYVMHQTDGEFGVFCDISELKLITDSYLYPNSSSPDTRGDVQLNKTIFAEDAKVAANCNGNSGYGTNIKNPDNIPFGSSGTGHYYVCKGGNWEPMGYCVPTSGHMDFAYIDTKTLQHFTLPYAGGNTKRVIVAYGGGSGKDNKIGSKGGYIKATVDLADNTQLTIFVGGHGEHRNSEDSHRGGGYGGGGYIMGSCGTDRGYGTSGGGMSFVSDYYSPPNMVERWLPSSHVERLYDRAKVFIVAGGAGGITEDSKLGGAGGGAEGRHGIDNSGGTSGEAGSGGTQTSPGKTGNTTYGIDGKRFRGGDTKYNHDPKNWCPGAGGGGWYGGASGQYGQDGWGGGGGGSAHAKGASSYQWSSGVSRNGGIYEDGFVRICWGGDSAC